MDNLINKMRSIKAVGDLDSDRELWQITEAIASNTTLDMKIRLEALAKMNELTGEDDEVSEEALEEWMKDMGYWDFCEARHPMTVKDLMEVLSKADPTDILMLHDPADKIHTILDVAGGVLHDRQVVVLSPRDHSTDFDEVEGMRSL